MSSAGALALLVVASFAALVSSVVVVSRLERLAGTWGLTEAMLGVLVALAADGPEITSAVTALGRGETSIGAGVVLGSNVFNLAALLGLSAIVAGRIRLHPRTVALEGAPAIAIAVVTLAVATGWVSTGLGLALVLVVVLPYLLVASGALPRRRAPAAPRGVAAGILLEAVEEAEAELAPAIHPTPRGRGDGVVVLLGLVVVVISSVAMERAASSLGAHLGISPLVIGAVLLAAVTSLPNAVGAVYLARRGRGSAVLSEAANSNMLNVLVGLLVPAVLLGAATASSDGRFVALWYLGMTVGCVAVAAARRGVGRVAGSLIVVAYAAFVLQALAR